MSSDENSPRPVRKKPNFRRPKPRAAKPASASGNTVDHDAVLNFFHRSNETYAGALKSSTPAANPTTTTTTSDAADAADPTVLNSDESSGDEGGNLRRRQANARAIRARYEKKRTRSRSNTPDDGRPAKIPSLSSSPLRSPARSPTPPTNPASPSPLPSPAPSASPELEETEDPYFAELERQARLKAQKRRAQRDSAVVGDKTPIHILVTSPIPNTEPVVFKYLLDKKFAGIKEAWCNHNRLDKQDVYFVWKGTKVFDWATCRGIGVKVDEEGHVEDQMGVSHEDAGPRIHFEAVNQEVMDERARREEVGSEDEEDEEVEEEEEKMTVVLKAKGAENLNVPVTKATTMAELVAVYREQRGVEAGRTVVLRFDGDDLEAGDTVEGVDLDDMDGIDVYVN